MGRAGFFIVLFLAVSSGAGSAQPGARPAQARLSEWQALESYVVRQLSCRGEPSFAPAVVYLGRRSILDVRRKGSYDSISCWTMTRPVSIRGLSIHAICGYSGDALTQILYPQLFSRDPGTSPPSTLAIVTAMPAASAQTWARQNLGEPAAGNRWKVEDSPLYSGHSELSCARPGTD